MTTTLIPVSTGWGGGEHPSYRELHHPNNIILFMRLVDRSPVWLAWGSAQVNWKPELCNGTGSWADIVPLVITQEACVSVYRLHLRFMAPIWEWNIRGQVMDVAVNGTEGAEMGHLYRRKNPQWNALKNDIIIASLINIPHGSTQNTSDKVLFEAQKLSLKSVKEIWFISRAVCTCLACDRCICPPVRALRAQKSSVSSSLFDPPLFSFLLIKGP